MTEARPLSIGDIVTVALPERDPQGHEQEGLKPAVVVGLPDRLGPARFPVVVVVPFSTYRDQSWVDAAPRRYPRFGAGTATLRSASVALLDQLLTIDIRRVQKRRGTLDKDQYEAIKRGLDMMLA